MNLHRLIFQNNSLKFILSFLLILFFCFNTQSEIPEKYKIESSLKKCKGSDYKKWTNCYGEYKFPRMEYKGEWQNGMLNGLGVLKEAYGGIYVGEFKDNLADGKGYQIETNGQKSEGLWKNDLMNGFGKISYPDGTYQEGNFVDWLLDGQGKIRFENSTYVGEVKEGFLEGYGKLTYDNGQFYEGNFKDDFKNGFGKETWVNGDTYEGFWKDDYQHGQGTQIWEDGSKYVGNWTTGQKDGYGEYFYPNGTIYKGNWVYGNHEGKGETKFNTGDHYIGDYKNGLMHGFGKYVYDNGTIYEGNFTDGLEDGNGKMTWEDGEYYEGEWQNGWRSGFGKYVYSNGTIYEGDFAESTAEGVGKFIYDDGTIYEGEVSDGYENGQGKVNYSNGDFYVGQFKDGYEHGKGKMVYANGDIYEGLWEDGNEAKGKTTLAKFTTEEDYYALIIGNNKYNNLDNLDAAVNDAIAIEKVLKEKYGFKTTILTDASYSETADAIIKFTKNRKKTDNLLIYYAGHGELEKDENRGYWLPVDAGKTQDSKWLGNDNIKNWIRSSKAKHILLIVDSCFSGTLMRGSNSDKSFLKHTKKSIDRLKNKTTRIVMTSGGNEPVVDSDGGNHSYFADKLLKVLKSKTDVFVSLELFQPVRQYVIENALGQTPEHSSIHGTGHDGGEFLFFPKS